MWVSRVRVSGGFLDGLDIRFTSGLNVIIGGRGSGKTSVLELIRHSMNLAHANVEQEQESAKFVRGVLGGGEVTLDVEDGAENYRVVVDATGAGRRLETKTGALMVGQNELEAIASDPPSRLSLLDIRAGVDARLDVPSGVARLTRRLFEIRASRAELAEAVGQLGIFVRQREEAREREAALLAGSAGLLDGQREELTQIDERLLKLRRSIAQLNDYEDELDDFKELVDVLGERLSSLESDIIPTDFRETAAGIHRDIAAGIGALNQAVNGAFASLAVRRARADQTEQRLLTESEPIKARLTEAETGLGQIAAELRALNAQVEALESARSERRQLGVEYERIAKQRDELLVELEKRGEDIYRERARIASRVSEELSKKASIRVTHLADTNAFEELLTEALRGSGLQYRSIVARLASEYLPRTLLEAVETNSVAAVAAAISLPKDRSARVVQALDTPDVLAQLAEMVLGDRADYLLRHGSEFKDVEHLSTGQKCAVTLPILMTEFERALLLDQPEDHLDNAYLVETVLGSIAKRRVHGSQTIIATHNANIPVLGNAETVIAMDSDGKRGFVEVAGPLLDPAIVERISSVMEGGRKAFEQRADFYGSSPR